jgi:hypothetical protein
MTKNKKSKPNAQQARQQHMEMIHKKRQEYFRKLCEIAQKIGMSPQVKKLINLIGDNLFLVRLSSIVLTPVENSPKLPPEIEKEIKKTIKDMLSFQKVAPYNNIKEVSAYEILFYLNFLCLHIVYMREENVDQATFLDEFNELEAFINQTEDDVNRYTFSALLTTAFILSNPPIKFISLQYIGSKENEKQKKTLTDSWSTCFEIGYQVVEPESIKIKVDGIVRTVYRMGCVNWSGKYVECNLQPHLYPKAGNKPIPVYIQRHALNRLNERLDSFFEAYRIVIPADSVINATEVIKKKDDRLLIPVICQECKMGYLVCQWIPGVGILILTFLFITSTGTPEGAILDNLTGLSKKDKEYLMVDKISTFCMSDFNNNPELVAILEEAQLGYLTELRNKITLLDLGNDNPHINANVINDFLKKKKIEESLSATELEELQEMSLMVMQSKQEELQQELCEKK